MKKIFLFIISINILLVAYKSNSQEQSIRTANAEQSLLTKIRINNVSTLDFQKAMELPNATLVDVRTLQEYNQGHIDGAIHVDWYKRNFRENISNIPKDKPILIYCRSGNRTSKTSGVLKSLGYTEIYNLQRGINEWLANKAPLTQEDSQKNKDFQKKITVGTELAQSKLSNSRNIYNVSASDFNKVINLKNINIIDIRTPQEYNSGHMKESINIDWYKRNFKEKIQRFAKDKPIAIYCRSGNRTSKATNVLHAMGFKEVINLTNGINDWNRNSLPLER